MVLLCAAPSKLPFGVSVFWLPMMVRMSSMASPYDDSARGLITTRTAGRLPPLIETSPTPGCWLIFCARRTSARSSTCVRPRVRLVSARVSTGVSAGLTLL